MGLNENHLKGLIESVFQKIQQESVGKTQTQNASSGTNNTYNGTNQINNNHTYKTKIVKPYDKRKSRPNKTSLHLCIKKQFKKAEFESFSHAENQTGETILSIYLFLS